MRSRSTSPAAPKGTPPQRCGVPGGEDVGGGRTVVGLALVGVGSVSGLTPATCAAASLACADVASLVLAAVALVTVTLAMAALLCARLPAPPAATPGRTILACVLLLMDCARAAFYSLHVPGRGYGVFTSWEACAAHGALGGSRARHKKHASLRAAVVAATAFVTGAGPVVPNEWYLVDTHDVALATLADPTPLLPAAPAAQLALPAPSTAAGGALTFPGPSSAAFTTVAAAAAAALALPGAAAPSPPPRAFPPPPPPPPPLPPPPPPPPPRPPPPPPMPYTPSPPPPSH